MSAEPSQRLDATFHALADPTRRAILARLAKGEASVAELAAPFSISQPAISKHLKILERAGLITVGQERQRRPRRLDPAPLAEASAWLERYRDHWEASFERLDALLEELKRDVDADTRIERSGGRRGRAGESRRTTGKAGKTGGTDGTGRTGKTGKTGKAGRTHQAGSPGSRPGPRVTLSKRRQGRTE